MIYLGENAGHGEFRHQTLAETWLKHNALILSPYNLGGPQYDSLANIIPITDQINIVLSVKIEGLVWYYQFGIPSIIIYMLLKGFLQNPLFSSTNQWEFGTSMDHIFSRVN